VSVELASQIKTSEPLADLLGHAERYLGAVPHEPFVLDEVVFRSNDVRVAPFVVPEQEVGGRRYKDAFTLWPHGYLHISTGRNARIGFSVGYRASIRDIDMGSYVPTADDLDDAEECGYFVSVNSGALRTRASFCLAALVVCATAERNQARILDEADLLKHGRWIAPGTLAAMFAGYGQARSFEELADRFCREIGFGASWPTTLQE
jgi:hypothetical protein